MDTIFQILVGATVLIGLFLVIYGVYGLISGEIYVIDKRKSGTYKASGGVARRYSLYYILAGGIWITYAVYRFLRG